jgi:hypothetical protein
MEIISSFAHRIILFMEAIEVVDDILIRDFLYLK